MKVNFTDDSKRVITIADVPTAKEIINSLKEEDIKELARTASNIAGGCDTYEILKAEAEIAKNSRIYNYYNDNSNTLDVWLEIYAYSEYKGFYNIGVYLSDLWSLDGENSKEIKRHMFLRVYKIAE